MLTHEQQELVKEWVHKLRSGEYKQGRYRFRSCNNEYCAVGVAGDLLVEKYPDTYYWDYYTRPHLSNHYCLKKQNQEGIAGCYSLLDEEEEKLLGIVYQNQEDIIALNDEGASFKEIALYIEQSLLT